MLTRYHRRYGRINGHVIMRTRLCNLCPLSLSLRDFVCIIRLYSFINASAREGGGSERFLNRRENWNLNNLKAFFIYSEKKLNTLWQKERLGGGNELQLSRQTRQLMVMTTFRRHATALSRPRRDLCSYSMPTQISHLLATSREINGPCKVVLMAAITLQRWARRFIADNELHWEPVEQWQ